MNWKPIVHIDQKTAAQGLRYSPNPGLPVLLENLPGGFVSLSLIERNDFNRTCRTGLHTLHIKITHVDFRTVYAGFTCRLDFGRPDIVWTNIDTSLAGSADACIK